MTQSEYAELREQATHFAIAPDEQHFDPMVETLVHEADRFWIVEKQGEAAQIAIDARESSPFDAND